MPAIVVIGYGNSLRGDDGFGPLAARLLEARQVEGAEVITSHQLGPELAAALAEAQFAVFLDATEGAEPGTLQVTAIEPCGFGPVAATHHFEPPALLALAQAVYGRAPAAVLITAASRSFEHGEQISPEVGEAAARAAEAIASLMAADRLAYQSLRQALCLRR